MKIRNTNNSKILPISFYDALPALPELQHVIVWDELKVSATSKTILGLRYTSRMRTSEDWIWLRSLECLESIQVSLERMVAIRQNSNSALPMPSRVHVEEGLLVNYYGQQVMKLTNPIDETVDVTLNLPSSLKQKVIKTIDESL